MNQISQPLIVITREDAKAQGLKRYFTNVPCKHGHVSERYVSTGTCCECDKQRNAAYHLEHPQRATVCYIKDAYPTALVPLTDHEQAFMDMLYHFRVKLEESTGIKWNVDHCYPLVHGGVHHPDNVWLLPASLNQEKWTSFDPSNPAQFRGWLVTQATRGNVDSETGVA